MVLANVFMGERDEDIQWDEPDTTLKFQHSGCLLPRIIVKGRDTLIMLVFFRHGSFFFL